MDGEYFTDEEVPLVLDRSLETAQDKADDAGKGRPGSASPSKAPRGRGAESDRDIWIFISYVGRFTILDLVPVGRKAATPIAAPEAGIKANSQKNHESAI
jgi:hypothetical protein